MANVKARPPGTAIKEYLTKHGISQQQFAERCGVTQSLVQQWISGRSRVTPQRAKTVIAASEGRLTRQKLFPELYSA